MDEPNVDVDVLRREVREKYSEISNKPEGDYHFHTGMAAAERAGYQTVWLDPVPDVALESFAGVANPFHWGLPAEGERVVDVGSGAGTDSLIAAHAVGEHGAVIGVDMTPAMLERSRAAAAQMGAGHIEFRDGVAEQLPVEDGWADVVISNGVINLVPDKVAAYREIARVLKPGGRVQVADICVEKEVPVSAQSDVDLWTG